MSRARRLEGRTCLIVGGTSGIGLATARRFLEEGARVVVAGKEDAGADAKTGDPGPVGDAIMQPLCALGPCAGFSLDASRGLEVHKLFEAAREFLGDRLDILFHAAGISGRSFGDGPLHACTDEGWDRVLDVNALSVYLTNREAVRAMRAQALDDAGLRGTVLNMGSVLAFSPSPQHFGTIAYAASKGAVQALTLAAAACYASERIRFNVLAPALIETPMSARAVNDPAIREYLVTKQPLTGGPGTVADCAQAALYLCEPASRFVTGVVLNVDGGWCVS